MSDTNQKSRHDAMIVALDTARAVTFEGADYPNAQAIANDFDNMIRRPIRETVLENTDIDGNITATYGLQSLADALEAARALARAYTEGRHGDEFDLDAVAEAAEIAVRAFGCDAKGEPLA
tara:strand:+ start:178 stop:540 length:363 start_codon:yes stop_codon:yes gene_type:complete